MEHDGCKGCRYERENSGSVNCQGCKQNAVDKYVKMTNADRIREMTNEELAEVFDDKVSSFDCDVCSSKYAGTDCCEESDCKPFARKWLKEWLESECDTE